jgi:multidrug resistance efflux pump
MKKLALIMTISAAALVLAACSAGTPAASAAPTTVTQNPSTIAIAEARLAPVNSLDQAFAAGGQLAEVLVQDGERVKAGQLLARLADSPQLKAALAQAQQQVLTAQQALADLQAQGELNLAQARLDEMAAQDAADQAQARYDSYDSDENAAELQKAEAELALSQARLNDLERGDGVAADALAAAQAALKTAQAAQESAQAALDALELRATLDGVVVDLNVQPGQWISAGQAVLTLADTSAWVVETDNLTETQVVLLNQGEKVTVVFDALPGQQFEGQITHINARFEEKRGDITYTVRIQLAQSNVQLRWGMTAAVYFGQ